MAAASRGAGRPRVAYFDLLAVMACLAVVAMHVDGAYWQFRPSPSWLVNLFVHKTFYWAVPVFYMLTGAKLLPSFRWEKLGGYLRKRFSRTVVPFLAWSLIGIVFGLVVTGDVPFGEAPSYYLGLVVGTSIPTENVLWFMVPLFSIYLAIPLLALVPEEYRIRAFGYALVAYLAISALNRTLSVVGVQANGSLSAPLNTAWLVYPLLGYILSHCAFDSRRRRAIYVLGIASWALMFFGTLTQSFREGALVHFASGGIDLPSILLASAVFLAVRTFSEQHPEALARHAAKLKQGGVLTFGVYLTHMFVLEIFIRLTGVQGASWWWGIAGVPVIFSLSMLLSALLNRIPVIRRLV